MITLVANLALATRAITAIAAKFGLHINFDPGKTEAVMALRGPMKA